MALQWMILGMVTVAEAVLVLLLTLPLPRPLRSQVLKLVRLTIQPTLAVVPFALFQLLDVYWKFEHRISCAATICTSLERSRFEKSTLKGHRNALLCLGAALFYWLTYRLTQVQTEILRLEDEVRKLKAE